MQIFEVIELDEFPYMKTIEITKGETIGEYFSDINQEKVLLMVDHDSKKIWTFNGLKSSFKKQIYGGILAKKMRQQLRLFYRVYPLNIYDKNDRKVQEILSKSIGGVQAKPITEKDFDKQKHHTNLYQDISIIPKVNVPKAMDYIEDIPKPNNYLRKFFIVGGYVFTEQEFTESFVQEKKTVKKPVKLGRLNRGFTLFNDKIRYSTRLIVKDRVVQGLEIYIHQEDSGKIEKLESKVPVFPDERFNTERQIELLFNALDLPEDLPHED
ncbi:MAG: hypothetical protein GF383_00795 [Candidatus Lokiarchaeota archaeon]|nr:hypothetical protein [Candidatus Lokiarchaeota archaeon]MBD3337711.1 hypothetical protein [Candidatus Lokiarchaeota archaeon]